MADSATHLEMTGSSTVDLSALAELAAGNGSPLRRILLSEPESLLQFFEQAADKIRGQLADRRRAEVERLRDLKLKALAELAAGAAHEINNPLAVISGQAQHLLKTEESLERARSLERIVAQCKRINQVLTDLMFFARPPQPHLRVMQLAKSIQSVVRASSALAMEKRVRMEVADSNRPACLGDPVLVEAALLGLITNALQAAPTDGWVRIAVESVGKAKLHVIVEDNGPGLTALEQEHLFDPFFSGRSAGRGAGLGLCKVWRIAEAHGGSVSFSSEAGQPTRFTLTLPVGSPPSGRAIRPKPRHSANGVRRNGKLHRQAR